MLFKSVVGLGIPRGEPRASPTALGTSSGSLRAGLSGKPPMGLGWDTQQEGCLPGRAGRRALGRAPFCPFRATGTRCGARASHQLSALAPGRAPGQAAQTGERRHESAALLLSPFRKLRIRQKVLVLPLLSTYCISSSVLSTWPPSGAGVAVSVSEGAVVTGKACSQSARRVAGPE